VTTVKGSVAPPGRSRAAHLREWRRESLWLWPAAAVIAAWIAGSLAARYFGGFELHEGLFPTDLDDARTLLSTIATALLTFTGVVFSITLVALQMASTQYSPRVLRTFVRKPVTKLALSTFLATFVYSLTLLARVGTASGPHTVPQGAVAIAYLLVMASVIVFVVFVNSTVRSMRVSYVIQAVFKETVATLAQAFPPADVYRDAAEPSLVSDPQRIPFDHVDAVVDGVDAHALVQLAARHDCVVRMCVPVGTYMPRGSDLLEVHGGTVPGTADVLATLNLSAVRTLYQDPSYGLRQLVDIACRALSAAVNDPTTAVQSLDRIHGLLRVAAARPDPTGFYLDDRGVVRLVRPVPGWDRLVELAFTEVEVYGSGDPQIPRKLMAIFGDLAGYVSPERQSVIERHREWLRTEVAHPHSLSLDEELTPDALGLG
jgi:uncharacterized membrane protein